MAAVVAIASAIAIVIAIACCHCYYSACKIFLATAIVTAVFRDGFLPK